MFMFWRIRYYDSRDSTFKNRDLFLETNLLEPLQRAAVELCYELGQETQHREMLRFRSMFRQRRFSKSKLQAKVDVHGNMMSFSLVDYFEDEKGKDVSGTLVTVKHQGTTRDLLLPGFPARRQATKRSAQPLADFDKVAMTPGQLTAMGYFCRDLQELMSTALMKEGPGTLVSQGDRLSLQTAATADDIRAFVMIFRRLYMEGEPAGFLKSVKMFRDVFLDDCLGPWVQQFADEYAKMLSKPPQMISGGKGDKGSFTCKRLIDVFLYTQFAHQPDERRARQFRECLKQIGGSPDKFVWLFLTTAWQCTFPMINAGRIMIRFYESYCLHHQAVDDIVTSVLRTNPGIGTVEKKDARRARLLREKSEELSMSLWQAAGRPHGGPTLFLRDAETQLRNLLDL